MQEYYFDGRTIRFFCKTKDRTKTTRKRFSWLYTESARVAKHLPFMVENYYGPAFFYNGIMNHRRKYQHGIDIIQRGIYRNKIFKGE